ncbi:2'-5' RNA ligase superfamily protein [Marinobacterium halophilum]|uniref:2'-5' RNA ligase superfamily protein n=1 Tax=Marinobacterium halophilum TaxID=267374 RepID=A0A2P8ERX2_9GAMM|nr:2'-5' RNA ligase family protein [Marinobacterium halophilum]PSL12193.1 2'-5' RNA ligase superfamily protein [Marinobacterium halophilum]
MTALGSNTFAVSLDDCPQWHHGIRHYAVWCLPVDDPDWLALIDHTQTRLSPWLHKGYARQPHITLFACGLVDKNHCPDAMLAAQIQSLELYSLSTMLYTSSGLSTFSTAPWLGIEDGDNRLQPLRNLLAHAAAEDSPPPQYQPHITLGFYRDTFALDAIEKALAPLQERALTLPPLHIDRVQLCYYDTHDIQGELTVKETIKLNPSAPVDNDATPINPLDEIKQMRQAQLRVCALKQQTELDQLVNQAKTGVDKSDKQT